MSSDLLMLMIGGAVVVFYLLFANRIKFKVNNSKSSNNRTSTTTQRDSRNELKRVLGIRNVFHDGTIFLDEYHYARVFYISTQDIELMSEAEQEALELNLIAAMRALDYPVQFFTTTQRVETSQQVQEIERFLRDPAVAMPDTLRSYCEHLRNELESLQRQKELVVRKSYMVIYVQEQNEKVAFEKLTQRQKNVIALLKKANFRVEQLNLTGVLQLLGDELNKNQVFKIENAIKSGALDLITTSEKGVVVNDEVISEVYGEETTRQFETIQK